MLAAAVTLITSALVLYSAGVWTEHHAGVLRARHAALFGGGLTMDALGTLIMSRIAAAHTSAPTGALTQVMQLTGGLALVLMALHLAWAVVVLLRSRAGEREAFHRFSLLVWGIWLIPYVTGMLGSAA